MTRLPFLRSSPASARANRRGRRRLLPAAVIMTVGSLGAMALGTTSAGAHTSAGTHTTAYHQVNLVSDIPGAANLTDPDLVNAWGLAASPGTDQVPGSPLWVSDNGSDKATLYNSGTATSVMKLGLVVNVTAGAPTGQVFNSDQSAFFVQDANGHSGPALFLFDSENGGIDGWNPGVGFTGSPPSTVTETAVDNGANAVYNGNFKPVELPGGLFVDPRLPAGYGPFGIQEIAGKLYVSYAKQDATLHDDVAGAGHGFVDVFTNDGALVRRLVTRGALNSPWGLALAPQSFGTFGGALLVGNFGNGHINAYDPVTGDHLGQLRQPNGNPIAIDGLWGLRFGNGNAAKTNELVFSAGPQEESHGLLGKIVVASSS